MFKTLSDPVGLKLFKLIANTLNDSNLVITSDFLQSQTKVTRKQFYSNMYRLVNKTSLISKKRGHYILSNYGKVVLHSLNVINKASKRFWALKVLDTNEISSGNIIPVEQMLEICARLIEDEDVRRIVCGPMIIDR